MSKLAVLQRRSAYAMGDPSLGSFLGKIGKGLVNIVGGALGLSPGASASQVTGQAIAQAAPAVKELVTHAVKTGKVSATPAASADLLAGAPRSRGGGGVRRAKGLSGRDLKGFNKTISLLKKVGMSPKRLPHTRYHHRRRG